MEGTVNDVVTPLYDNLQYWQYERRKVLREIVYAKCSQDSFAVRALRGELVHIQESLQKAKEGTP